MKVLIVCSGNVSKEQQFDLKIHQTFIHEQVESLKIFGVEFDYFIIHGKGIIGYLRYSLRLKKICKNNYDLIHAHYGFCGFIANLQKRIPVITTFHGSDINLLPLRLISYFPIMKSNQSIFVSDEQLGKVLFRKKVKVIPCGVNLNLFYPLIFTIGVGSNSSENNTKHILFSSSFSIHIKNSSLATAAIKMLGIEGIELLELKNKTREEVRNLLNTSDLLLLTSFSEGSPQVIKEAMACNCPIVSTDVGDVRWLFGSTPGHYITSFEPNDVAENIKLALEFRQKFKQTKGRERIIELGLDSESIAMKIFEVYKKVLNG